MTEHAGLKEKLFSIAVKERSYTRHSKIILPNSRSPLSRERLFPGRGNRNVLELGAGWGEFIVNWALQNPGDNAVTFEVKADRIQNLLTQLDKKKIESVRVIPVNFSWFLEEILPPGVFDLVFVNFPDPWPKRRHRKHRLVNPDFPERIYGLMKPGAVIHLSTDYTPYARKMIHAFRNHNGFTALTGGIGLTPVRPDGIPETRFERMQKKAGYKPLFTQWKKTGKN